MLPNPHGPIQQQIMMSMFDPDLLEMWVACGSKFGKSIAAAAAINAAAWMKQDGLFRWVAPIYSQARIGFRYCNRMLPGEPAVTPNKSDPSLTINAKETKIEFRSGKYPEDLEGEACHGYINDECAKMVEQVYDSEKTTTTVTRGKIISISTPRGKGWFYAKCMAAKEEMDWALKKGIKPKRIFLTAPSTANPFVTSEAILDNKKNMPDRLYRQYFLAEFVDNGSVFSNFRDCIFGDYFELDGEYQRWFHETAKDCQVVIGVDWAKTKDRTVFTATDLATRNVVGVERFYKTPYTEAIRRLLLFTRKFKEEIATLHDKTGIGSVIDDQLAYTPIKAQGIVFTNASKADMVTKLITATEQKSIGLPNWKDLIEEMDAFEVSATATGMMSYNAPSGLHDDIVCSLMLSHLALLQYADRDMKIIFMEDLIKDKSFDEPSTIEQYYNRIVDDEDDY